MAAITLDFENHPQVRFRIDNFSVPASARADFQAAMQRNFAFIQTLPGFQCHLVFEKASGPSTFNVVTVAVWESPEAIEKAIVAKRDYYEKIVSTQPPRQPSGVSHLRWVSSTCSPMEIRMSRDH